MSTNPSFNSVKAQKSYVFVSSHICCSCRSDQGGGWYKKLERCSWQREARSRTSTKQATAEHQHEQIASADNWGINEKEEEWPEPVDQWWL